MKAFEGAAAYCFEDIRSIEVRSDSILYVAWEFREDISLEKIQQFLKLQTQVGTYAVTSQKSYDPDEYDGDIIKQKVSMY